MVDGSTNDQNLESSAAVLGLLAIIVIAGDVFTALTLPPSNLQLGLK
jgi:hypothetical protein